MSSRQLPLPVVVPVAGVAVRQDAVGLAAEGEPVQIVHQPDNPYDPNACAVVLADGTQVGYVPAALAGRLVLHGTGPWDGTITAVLTAQETWGLRVRIERAADGDSNAAEAGREMDAPVGRPMVTAASGRQLGELVEVTETMVVVEDRGRRAAYPLDVVRGIQELRATAAGPAGA